MSNMPSNLKQHNKRLKKHEIENIVSKVRREKGPMKMPLDVANMTLDKTLVVNVDTSEVKLGNAQQKVKDIPVQFTLTSDQAVTAEFLTWLETHTAETVNKVVMYKSDGFKVKTLDEFITDVKTFIAAQLAPIDVVPAQSDLVVTNYEVYHTDVSISPV